MQVFWPWQRSSVADVLHHARRCYLQSRKMFLQHRNLFFFLRFFPLLLSSSGFLSHPLPLLALPSQSIPHFWSIFYALLHYSQLPFTVHYLLPSFTNTLYTSLSFLQSLCLPPSLPRSPPVRYNTFLYVSPSPPFYYLFVFSPVTSSHANLTRFFPPLIFTSHLVCHSVYIPAACLRWCHPSFLIDYSKHVMYFGT